MGNASRGGAVSGDELGNMNMFHATEQEAPDNVLKKIQNKSCMCFKNELGFEIVYHKSMSDHVVLTASRSIDD